MDSDPQRTGDPYTFDELFVRYKNLVYKTAYLLLRDRGEAEEALQEVFVLVFKSLSSFDPQKGALATWLYRITVNHCLSQRRRRRPWVKPPEELERMGTVEPALADSAEREAMVQAIGRLSDKQRVVVILRFYWDLPYAEIAQVLNIPLGTVKSRIDLALRTLRKSLVEERIDEEVLSSSQGLAPREECSP